MGPNGRRSRREARRSVIFITMPPAEPWQGDNVGLGHHSLPAQAPPALGCTASRVRPGYFPAKCLLKMLTFSTRYVVGFFRTAAAGPPAGPGGELAFRRLIEPLDYPGTCPCRASQGRQ